MIGQACELTDQCLWQCSRILVE